MKYIENTKIKVAQLLALTLVLAMVAMFYCIFFMPKVIRPTKETRHEIIKKEMYAIVTAMNFFYRDCGFYSEKMSHLYVDDGIHKWKGPYLQYSDTLDPYGTEFKVTVKIFYVELRSAGADLTFDTDDDTTLTFKQSDLIRATLMHVND